MINRLRQFLKHAGGGAAVELALVAPVLGAMVIVSYGIWDLASRRQDMRAGLDAAALYYMNGGADDAAARAAALSAWQSHPDDAAVESERACRCGTAPGACDTLCEAVKPPSVYVTLTATGETVGALLAPTVVEERTIRVR